MKILEINLIEFGGLKDRCLTLGEGLNLFEGENEAGKSTVLLFIKFMLYGLGRKNQEDYERAVSRSGHCARGTMTLCNRGENYRIERDFSEGARSGSERLHLYRLSDGEEIALSGQPGEFFLGVGREAFESSCYIGQMKLGGVSDKKGSDAIRNLLSSADESTDVTRIEDKLEKIRVTYRHKTGKGGRLWELEGRLADERAQYDRAVETHRHVLTEQERFDRAQEQADQNEKALERTNQILLGIGKIGVLRRFDRLRTTERDYARLNEIREQTRNRFLKNEYMPTASDVAALRHLADAVDTAEVAFAQADRACAEQGEASVDARMARYAEQLAALGGYGVLAKRVGSLRKRRTAFFVLCAIGVVSIPILLLLNPIFAAAGAVFAIAFALLAVFSSKAIGRLASEYDCKAGTLLSYAQSCEAYTRQMQEQSERRERLFVARSVAEEQLSASRARLIEAMKKTVAEVEGADVAAARAEADRVEQYLSADREAEIRSQSLLHAIAEESAALAAYDEDALRAEVDPALWDMTPADVARAEREQKFYAEKKKTLEMSMRQSQIELISARAGFTSPVEIADRLAQTEDELAQATRYADALVLAIESLQDAAKSMSGSVTPALAKDASALMRRISGGRYVELTTGAAFAPSLLLENQLSVPLELMSGGTRDAAYLSLRIALMMQIYAGELPPLLMDEALCQLDDRRVAEVLSFLSRMCGEQMQVLLFTCHTRERQICQTQELACHSIKL